MLNVKKTLAHILEAVSVDYIVEQGTSGQWTYRKWNSGIAECWIKYDVSVGVTTSSAQYGGYRSDSISVPSFPFTFTAVPSLTISISGGSQGSWVNNATATATGCSFYLSSGASQSARTRNMSVQVMGKWK